MSPHPGDPRQKVVAPALQYRAEQATRPLETRRLGTRSIPLLCRLRHGVDRDAALRAACAFGGGIARTGSICGAVSGALIAIGLRYGRTRVEDEAAREKTYEVALELLGRFRQEHGSDMCRELLGVDIGTAEGREAAIKGGLFRSRCPELVRSAAHLVSTLV